MKRIFLLSLFVGLLFSCSKDEEPSIPEKKINLETLQPTSLYGKGVMFSGRILHLNKEKVLEHGFLVRSQITPWGSDSTYYKINSSVVSGDNQLIVPDFLKSADRFEVQYYVKTSDQFYRGDFLSFHISEINVFGNIDTLMYPGDKLVFHGDFSKLSANYQLKVKSENGSFSDMNYTVSASKDQISINIPTNAFHGDSYTFYLQDKAYTNIFLGKVAVLGKLEPLTRYTYYYTESVDFKGLGLRGANKAPFFLIVGNRFIPYNSRFAMRELLGGVPGNDFRIGYYNGIDTVIFPQKLILPKAPANALKFIDKVVHPFSKARVYNGSTMQYMPLDFRAVTIGGFDTRLTHSWNGEDVLDIGEIPDGDYPAVIKSHVGIYTSGEKLRVQQLKVTGVSPSEVYAGESVTIKGNFIDGINYTVEDGSRITIIGTAKNGEIVIRPFGRDTVNRFDLRKISYSEINSSVDFSNLGLHVKFKPATYTGFSPSEGTYRTRVTVYGRGIGGSFVQIGNALIPFYERTENSASFYVPASVLPGKYKIAVFYKNEWLINDQVFEIK